MTRVVYSSLARRDALEILELISNEAGEAAAVGYARKFDDVVDRLAVYPEGYSHRYAQTSRTVTLLRLIHGRRKITSDFMKMP